MHEINALLHGFPGLAGGTVDKIGPRQDAETPGQVKGPLYVRGCYVFVQKIPYPFRAAFHAVADLNAAGLPQPEQHFLVNAVDPGDGLPGDGQLFFQDQSADLQHPFPFEGKGIV